MYVSVLDNFTHVYLDFVLEARTFTGLKLTDSDRLEVSKPQESACLSASLAWVLQHMQHCA